MKKFRPQEQSGKWALKNFRDGIFVGEYNWHTFDIGIQPRWIFKSFGIHHYYTAHAPEPIYKKWKQCRLRWNKRRAINASSRYIETYTIDRNL